jgi:plastocyanin
LKQNPKKKNLNITAAYNYRNHMNKYLILMFVLVGLIALGVVYRMFLLPDSQKPVDTGVVREVTVLIPKNSWSFIPEVIDADLGDTLKIKFINEDDYDHGVGIDAYGVSQRIPAGATLDVPPFVVTKAGDYQFYCSVSCGEGIAASGPYQGVKRTHFDQIGTICVHKVPGDRVCMNSAPTAEMLKAREEAALLQTPALPNTPQATPTPEMQ